MGKDLKKPDFTRLVSKPIIILCVLLVSLAGFAQQSVLDHGQALPDSVSKTSVMVIPYQPLFYISDADRDIAEASKKPVENIRARFRSTLDASLIHITNLSFKSQSLLSSNKEMVDLLDRVYAASEYKYESATQLHGKVKTKNKPQRPAVKESLDKSEKVSVASDVNTGSYLHVFLTDTTILPGIAEKYGIDMFVFLTQFEIKINYSDCLDLANKIYNRNVRVHYTVYDKTGRFVRGEAVQTSCPSNVNHVDDIINRNFPAIVEHIYYALPRQAPTKDVRNKKG